MTPILPAAILLPALLAAPGNPEVDALAKRGHWLEDAWSSHSQLLGKPAPALELSGWLSSPVRAEQMKGKVVVVDFWATWCGPCRKAIPHNNDLQARYAAQGVLVIGACGGGHEDRMAEVARTEGIAYPTAQVSAASTRAWRVSYWPTYAILDRKGDLRALGVRPDAVEGIVQALLAER